MKAQWQGAGAPGRAPDSAALLAERAALRLELLAAADTHWAVVGRCRAGDDRTPRDLLLDLAYAEPPAPLEQLRAILVRCRQYEALLPEEYRHG